MDELIAYGQIPIPEAVFRQESVDQWLQLSGKQGENKEGSIHLMFTLLVIVVFSAVRIQLKKYFSISANCCSTTDCTGSYGIHYGPNVCRRLSHSELDCCPCWTSAHGYPNDGDARLCPCLCTSTGLQSTQSRYRNGTLQFQFPRKSPSCFSSQTTYRRGKQSNFSFFRAALLYFSCHF